MDCCQLLGDVRGAFKIPNIFEAVLFAGDCRRCSGATEQGHTSSHDHFLFVQVASGWSYLKHQWFCISAAKSRLQRNGAGHDWGSPGSSGSSKAGWEEIRFPTDPDAWVELIWADSNVSEPWFPFNARGVHDRRCEEFLSTRCQTVLNIVKPLSFFWVTISSMQQSFLVTESLWVTPFLRVAKAEAGNVSSNGRQGEDLLQLEAGNVESEISKWTPSGEILGTVASVVVFIHGLNCLGIYLIFLSCLFPNITCQWFLKARIYYCTFLYVH